MKIAIMQPYFFPYIGYFQAIHAVDKYILYDNLNFIKESWMNRNSFLVKNGSPSFFYAELKEKSSFKKISEIELVENDAWRKRMLNSLFLNYKKADYFEEVYPVIETVVNYPTNKLSELNYQSLAKVCEYLELGNKVVRSSNSKSDLETKLHKEPVDKNDFPALKVTDCNRKVIRVLEICRMEGADVFINAIGGQSLYNKKTFKDNGIDLFFVKTLEYKYKQQSAIFYPHLSIIDVLMNCGKIETNALIKNYELI
jgi:hypothetical protein